MGSCGGGEGGGEGKRADGEGQGGKRGAGRFVGTPHWGGRVWGREIGWVMERKTEEACKEGKGEGAT